MATSTPSRAPSRTANPNRTTRESQKQRAERAREWRQFRKDFLFSQRALADHLSCARRTIVSIEGGEVTPNVTLQRKFRDLKRQQELQQKRYENEVA